MTWAWLEELDIMNAYPIPAVISDPNANVTEHFSSFIMLHSVFHHSDGQMYTVHFQSL